LQVTHGGDLVEAPMVTQRRPISAESPVMITPAPVNPEVSI
jgi:hypothetical protein